MEEYISFQEEERNGYVITEKLKKIWNVELNLLVTLLNVCEKYNLKISVYAGTMLGAVRHQGFIPWDDDMDVAMPRKDYEKLISIADKEFKSPYFLQTAKNDKKFFVSYARLRNSNTTGMITWNRSKDYNNGIFIDIFPLDGVTQNPVYLNVQILKKTILEQFLKVYYSDELYVSRKPKILTKLLKKIANLKSYDFLIEKYEEVLKKYNETSSVVSLVTHEKCAIKKYWCYDTDFNSLCYLPFETIKVPVLMNYNSCLTHFYGQYMNFPAPELRGKWHENMIVFNPDVSYKDFISKQEKGCSNL